MSSRNRVDALALSPFMKDCSLRQIRFGYVNTPMMQNKGQITLNIKYCAAANSKKEYIAYVSHINQFDESIYCRVLQS